MNIWLVVMLPGWVKIYRFLGLTVGVNTRVLKTKKKKRDAYACDITYTTKLRTWI